MHVKYTPAPAWYAQVGDGHPTSFAVNVGPAPLPVPVPVAFEPLPEPRPGPVGPVLAGFPHAMIPNIDSAAITTLWRTRQL